MSLEKPLPFPRKVWDEIAATYGTPVYVYDEAGIIENAERINKAFDWCEDHTNYFAVKATPTPAILRTVHGTGMGFDCSSRPELRMVQDEHLEENGVFYSSNNTPDADYQLAEDMGAVINVDKAAYVTQVARALGNLPSRMAIRYNPGAAKEGSPIIGNPIEAKFGARDDQIFAAVDQMHAGGVEQIGLHTMVVSNEKEPMKFAETAKLLRELVERIDERSEAIISFINIGGGIGVNYKPDEQLVDVEGIGQAVESVLGDLGIPILTENGRYVTGPHGYLVAGVTHGVQEVWRKFLQIDSSVNNMARLATVSAAYHEIDILGREGDPKAVMDVTGSMCANSDRMFRDRLLPWTARPGDLMVIHDAGAHSRSNSHNYNFRLRAGEVMVHTDGSISLIRRPETEDDLFATTKGL